MLAHSPANHRAIHCRRPDLAALLLALLHAHLTALLFLQLAAQRHSRATLPARQDPGKRACARIPLRHRAPFGTCNAHTSGAIAPSTAPPTSCSHSKTTATNIRGIRPRHLRADHLPPHDACARCRARVPHLLMRARATQIAHACAFLFPDREKLHADQHALLFAPQVAQDVPQHFPQLPARTGSRDPRSQRVEPNSGAKHA